MSTAIGVHDGLPVLDPLKGLELRLSGLDRGELREILAPVIERLHERLPEAEAARVAETALALCRRLYANARSGEALPLARAVLAQASLGSDRALERRAATACGLLAADIADVVGAMEYHIRALRMAHDPVEASGVWNNIGLAMGIAANYEMASRCYQRSVNLLEPIAGTVYARYAACGNLAQSHFENGAYGEGLHFAHRALAEQTEAFRALDVIADLLLRRNIVRLLVAMGRVGEAGPYVAEASAIAEEIRTPRASIAAATTRAVYEVATGCTDVGLTRLENALSRAREVPAALRETLACVVHAEEQAGNSERALLRLRELSDHVYRSAVERARQYVEFAAIEAHAVTSLDHEREQVRARLVSRLAPPVQPENWAALQRLAVSAVMRMDRTGWHGKRVGALAKALAVASGVDPLQSLEIGLASELHDIGMASVPEEILARRGPISEAERHILERHVDAGAEILRDDRHPRILLAREIARYHHAAWDGAGYPERVAGRLIPFAARVCAVADAYDEMMFGLCGTPARNMEQALQELRAGAGSRFDPQLVDRFDTLIRTETEDLGLDLASDAGMESFQELVNALQEDRGFV